MSRNPAPSILDPSSPLSPLSHKTSTALLLMDYHTFFARPDFPSASPAIAKATALLTWARASNIAVTHALMDMTLPIPALYKETPLLEGMKGMLATVPAMGAEIPSLSGREQGEAYITRAPGVFCALSAADFEELRHKGVTSLVMAGISTSGCVLRTSSVAADEGFVVTVVEDACADPKGEVHRLLTETVMPAQAHVVGTREFVDAWGA